MKGNKKLFILLVLIGTLAAAHGMGSMHMGKNKGDDDDNVMMGMNAEEYWDRVKGDDFKFSGTVRKYYISADETWWDYAPEGINIVNGSELQGIAHPFIEIGPQRIGTTFLKCRYRAYTDDTFSKLVPIKEDEKYMGVLGPAIYAEVGDVIKVVFRNKCRFPTSMYPHHLYYNKANEGALYNDTTTGEEKTGDIVETGETHTYVWPVPERSGPGPSDGSSIMSVYFSHVDLNPDFYAGLVGPISITRKGMARKDGTAKDLDRMLFIMYSVGVEAQNPLLAQSFERFATSPPGTALPTDGGFTGSLSKFSINGYIYGNGHIPIIKQYEQVRWCTFSLGNNDAHTPHWHGNTILVHGMRMDVTSIMPGEIVCSDMKPDDVGYWLTHCHVGDHLDDGMVTRFQVLPSDKRERKSALYEWDLKNDATKTPDSKFRRA